LLRFVQFKESVDPITESPVSHLVLLSEYSFSGFTWTFPPFCFVLFRSFYILFSDRTEFSPPIGVLLASKDPPGFSPAFIKPGLSGGYKEPRLATCCWWLLSLFCAPLPFPSLKNIQRRFPLFFGLFLVFFPVWSLMRHSSRDPRLRPRASCQPGFFFSSFS